MSSSHLFVLTVLLAISSTAGAFSFYDSMAGGTPLSAIGALSDAICGQRSTYHWDALAIFTNPAGLAALHGPTATASAGALSWKEVTSYGSERQLRSSTIPGTRSLAGSIPVDGRLTAGAGVAVVSDAYYVGTHSLQDASVPGGSPLLEILHANGGQYEALAGLGYDAGHGLSVGASGGMRFGEVDLDYALYDPFTGQNDSTSLTTLETSEAAVRCGSMLSGEIGSLGVSYCTAGRRFPASIAVGAEAVAPHIGGTVAGFELQVSSPFGRNDIDGRFACRYPVSARTVLMAGLSFGDYTSSLGKGMGFSVGGTRSVGPVRLDLGAHWWTRNREGSAFEGEAADEIDDSTFEFALGVTYAP